MCCYLLVGYNLECQIIIFENNKHISPSTNVQLYSVDNCLIIMKIGQKTLMHYAKKMINVSKGMMHLRRDAKICMTVYIPCMHTLSCYPCLTNHLIVLRSFSISLLTICVMKYP